MFNNQCVLVRTLKRQAIVLGLRVLLVRLNMVTLTFISIEHKLYKWDEDSLDRYKDINETSSCNNRVLVCV